MTRLMGSTMAIMLGFMLGMYRNRWVNIAIVAESLVLPLLIDQGPKKRRVSQSRLAV